MRPCRPSASTCPGFTERATSGANTFSLSYAGRTDTQTRSELGARFDHAMPMQDAVATLRGRAAWAHDFDTDRIANPVLIALPGAAFTVNGARALADSLLVSAGAELLMRNGVSLAGSFEGEFSGNTKSYAGKDPLSLVSVAWAADRADGGIATFDPPRLPRPRSGCGRNGPPP